MEAGGGGGRKVEDREQGGERRVSSWRRGFTLPSVSAPGAKTESSTCLNCIMWEGFYLRSGCMEGVGWALQTPSCQVQHALVRALHVTGGSGDLKCNVLSPEDNCVL